MDDEGPVVGQAITTPDVFYDAYESAPIAGEIGAFDPPDDLLFHQPDSFSFSFSEADLVPLSPPWGGIDYPYSAALDMTRSDDAILYSRVDEEPPESKITIHRAFVVSEPPTPTHDAMPAAPTEGRTKEEKKLGRISRTFSSLRRRTKQTAPSDQLPQDVPPTPAKAEKQASTIVQTSEVEAKSPDKEQSSRGRRRSVSRSREHSTPSIFSRSKSRDAASHRRQLSKKTVRPESPPPPSPQKRATAPPAVFRTSSKALPPLSIPVVPLPSIPAEQPVPKTVPDAPPAPPPPAPKRQPSRKSILIPQRAPPKPRDELGPLLKTLENHHQRYLAKFTATKCSIVETCLLPFLRDTDSHPSTIDLHIELLERRCTVLSKWWSSLLDLMEDWQDHVVSSRERSFIFDGISGIMQRQEWRLIPDFAPLSEVRSRSQSQLSGDDAILAESVFHDIRVLFVRNLSRQMAIVVDRLSSRDTAPALTSLSGLSCAYASFFCPGVAEMLIGLWNLPSINVRKVVETIACESPTELKLASQRMAVNFPSCLHSLTFISARNTLSKLQSRHVFVFGLNNINWHNPHWLEKWNGKKTDVIFVFFRHFQTLLSQFLPSNSSEVDTMSAPGYIPIHVKMMIVLQTTFQSRRDKLADQTVGVPTTTFEAMLDAESKAMTVPPPPGPTRSLIGKRLVALLKDIFPETADAPSRASLLFAQCVRKALKAATQQTSLYDHDACFNLCDLLEEIIPALDRFETHAPTTTADSDAVFWVDVFKLMLVSDNTLTAMRVFTLVFNLWPSVTKDFHWRNTLCYRFLLEKSSFNTFFNHWCPLVRIYFMRVLAWRVARYDEDDESSDTMIPMTLFWRTQESWSYYKHDLAEAEEGGKLLPSTAPCNPIPGRRLLIIRTDSPLSTLHSSANVTPNPATPYTKEKPAIPSEKDESYFSPSQLFAKLTVTIEEGLEQGKRRSSLFRAITNRSNNDAQSPTATADSVLVPPSPTSPISPSETSSRASLYQQRPVFSMAPARETRESLKARLSAQHSMLSSSSQATVSTAASFKFSLEVVDRRPNAELVLSPPRLPLLAHLAIESQPGFVTDVPANKAEGPAAVSAKYAGRALAEWSLTVNECQNFFERRRKEGVQSNREVETPSLSVEPFRRIM